MIGAQQTLCRTAGYLVQGSNGEYIYLSLEERVEMVRRARAAVPAPRLLLAGSGCESTGDTIRLSRAMAEAGADAVVVVTPCYYKSGMNVRGSGNRSRNNH